MNLHLLPIVNKARRPKFDVHLKVYDLNNVPLVQGSSHIRWHLPHSIHSDHRGRTPKCPIAKHRVEYNYGKIIPVRLAIDKSNNLSECPIEFEVIQEFPTAPSSVVGGAAGAGSGTGGNAGGGREERITLGRLTLNLAEYVEESEAFARDLLLRPPRRTPGPSSVPSAAKSSGQAHGHTRTRSGLSTSAPITASDASSPTTPRTSTDDISPTSTDPQQQSQPSPKFEALNVEDGVVRRYLMTESKINSTLKIGILMVQVDGERNYVAPPLKTAPVFGGITGLAGGSGRGASSSDSVHNSDFSQHFQDTLPENDAASLSAQFSNPATAGGSSGKQNRDLYELQDVYRRALAASWAGHPLELPADDCIEDIFQGGDGFGPDGADYYAAGGSGNLPGEATPRGHGQGARGHGHGHSRGASRSSVNLPDSSTTRTAKIRRGDSGSSTGGVEDFLHPGEAATGGGGGGRLGGSRGLGGILSSSRKNSHHNRHGSGESNGSGLSGHHHHGGHNGGGGGIFGLGGGGGHHSRSHNPQSRRDRSKDSERSSPRRGMRQRSESLTSLANTIESERGRSGFKSTREVNEWEMRDDLVAWKLPGTAA
ncbi:N-terminal C2 in EEIG1 and EHBP1 proteins-domain-containing protein [Coniella lustricola]|uniref:N-terminal C2 in EEIG1 and EHBP1 proteins-domain-containing protein n=1 Tax=Coniella lustricola TaxID=2025994 RepID=A0A2T3A9M7_9PEZI|nr:N-terminal C2 in EEIG1 and EHBP1 proteins-domain-containing protein [Coniella lustricola]